MTDAKANLAAAKARLGAFTKATPTLMQGFGTISRQATAAGSFFSGRWSMASADPFSGVSSLSGSSRGAGCLDGLLVFFSEE